MRILGIDPGYNIIGYGVIETNGCKVVDYGVITTPKNMPIMMMDGWFFSRGTSLTGTVKFFRVSKEDFLMVQQSVGNASIKKDETKVVVGVYGAPYSNTDLAYKTHLIRELTRQRYHIDSSRI